MRIKLSAILMTAFALGAAVPVFAHHGFAVEFDASKCMDLKGTLTGIDWQNPHAYFHMDVKNADGKTDSWSLEMVTPNALKRNGTTREDFLTNIGKPIAARACPGQGRRYRSTEVRRNSWSYRMARCGSPGNLLKKLRPNNFTSER